MNERIEDIEEAWDEAEWEDTWREMCKLARVDPLTYRGCIMVKQ